jgi:hypothetical protein
MLEANVKTGLQTDDETRGFIKCRKCLDWLKDFEFIKQDSALCSYFFADSIDVANAAVFVISASTSWPVSVKRTETVPRKLFVGRPYTLQFMLINSIGVRVSGIPPEHIIAIYFDTILLF